MDSFERLLEALDKYTWFFVLIAVNFVLINLKLSKSPITAFFSIAKNLSKWLYDNTLGRLKGKFTRKKGQSADKLVKDAEVKDDSALIDTSKKETEEVAK